MAHPLPSIWPDALPRWTTDPFALGTVAVMALTYGHGLRRLWRRAGPGNGIRRSEALAYGAGAASLVLALSSPLDYLSDLLFSAHMAQHEMLMVVSAPLIVLGRPFIAFLWALPRPARIRFTSLLANTNVRAAWHFISAPLFVLALHAVVRWVWHIPRFFEAAMANEALHAVQHLSFFLTAALFFWAVIHGRYGKAGYGLGFLFVFATALHTSVLGALIAFTPVLIYPVYRARAFLEGVDPQVDQQLAGFIMWIPSGLILGIGALVLFAMWLMESDRRDVREARLRFEQGHEKIAPPVADL